MVRPTKKPNMRTLLLLFGLSIGLTGAFSLSSTKVEHLLKSRKLTGTKSMLNAASDRNLVLYRDTNGWCPFCERTWLLLHQTQTPYEEKLINLRDKVCRSSSLASLAHPILSPAHPLLFSPAPPHRSLNSTSSLFPQALCPQFSLTFQPAPTRTF